MSNRRVARRMPLLMPDDFQELNLVSWRVEQGVPDSHNPLLEPEMPWDSEGVMAHGTVLHDPIDGLWKAWQVSTPGGYELSGLETAHEAQRRLTYLESKDGVDWYRPKLPLVSWPGHELTNIVLDLDSGGTASYASVLVDPTDEEYPYEMFVLRSPVVGPDPMHVGHLPASSEKRATYRYRSGDGKDWQLVEGPIYPAVGGGVDVCYVYRESDGSYVSYFKSYPKLREGDRMIPYDNNPRGGLRQISRRTSVDGSTWGNESVVLGRDWRDPDFAQYLELCPVKTNGGYVASVNYYNASIQTMSLELAASRDGIHWWRPDRRPALPNLPLGDYGGGMIWHMHHPIIENEKMHVYYAGSEGIHGEIFDTRFGPRIEVGGETVIESQTPTLPFNTALCRATWQFDRLWALVTSAGGMTTGEATTRAAATGGGQLEVNVRVKPRGELRAELQDESGRTLPGFSAEECVPQTGDHTRVAVTWKQGTKVPDGKVSVRFILRRAFLYGYEWAPR